MSGQLNEKGPPMLRRMWDWLKDQSSSTNLFQLHQPQRATEDPRRMEGRLVIRALRTAYLWCKRPGRGGFPPETRKIFQRITVTPVAQFGLLFEHPRVKNTHKLEPTVRPAGSCPGEHAPHRAATRMNPRFSACISLDGHRIPPTMPDQ